jgi:hypothetical protein
MSNGISNPRQSAPSMVEIVDLAASAESGEYTEGVLAGLALAGRADMQGTFLTLLLLAADTGVSLAELVALETAGGAR